MAASGGLGGQVDADDLLPLVYEELRRLATQRLTQEPAGQTLQATALVHEAYIQLVDQKEERRWDSRPGIKVHPSRYSLRSISAWHTTIA